MSSKATSAPIGDDLTKVERLHLGRLGYKREDLDPLLPSEARLLIRNKTYKPGSKAYAKHAINPLTGTPGVPLADRHTDEAIAERNEGKGTVEAMVNEWYRKNQDSMELTGMTAFDAAASRVQRDPRFAALVFRWLEPGINAKLTTQGWERFIHPDTGQSIEVGGQYLAFRPKEVQAERERHDREMVERQFRRSTEVRGTAAAAGGGINITRDDIRMTREKDVDPRLGEQEIRL